MANGDGVKKSAKFVTVMSALPADHEFKLGDGRSLTIKGQPQSKFVGTNGIPYAGNQHGETPNVKAEDWEYILKTYQAPKGDKKLGLRFLNSGVMFAASTVDEKKSKKKDKKDVKTGLEQLNPKKTQTKPVEKKED